MRPIKISINFITTLDCWKLFDIEFSPEMSSWWQREREKKVKEWTDEWKEGSKRRKKKGKKKLRAGREKERGTGVLLTFNGICLPDRLTWAHFV